MMRVWRVATLALCAAALGACQGQVPIEGAACPCPRGSGFCCNENNVCVPDGMCAATGGVGGGVAGASGQAGAGSAGGAASGGVAGGAGGIDGGATGGIGGATGGIGGATGGVGGATGGVGGATGGIGGAGATGGIGGATGGIGGATGGSVGATGGIGGATGGIGGATGGIGGAIGGSVGATGGMGGATGGMGGATGGMGGATGGIGGATGGIGGATGGIGGATGGIGGATGGIGGAIGGSAGFQSACDPSITDDDSVIHITGAEQIAPTRRNLLLNIFNSGSLPNPMVPAANVHLNVNLSTVPAGLQDELSGLLGQLPDVGRVDMLEYPMKDTTGKVVFTSLAWHFIPASGAKNKLVIVHQGHDNTLIDPVPGDDAGGPGGRGLASTIEALLFDGYSVLAMYMPQYRPDDLSTPNHAYLMNSVKPQGGGSGTRFFMEPVRAFLSYLETSSAADAFPHYTDYDMTGVSGGGWTTTVYAAIDPTIELSFPIAGSIPLYLRCPTGTAATYPHDAEQFQGNGIYHIAGYQDLYVLGATGTNSNGFPRHQTQVLNRVDDCCFGQAQQAASLGPWDVAVTHYELNVRNAIYNLGQGGMFRLEIDENNTSVDGHYHMVGHQEIYRTILGELDDARKVIGRQAGNSPGDDSDAFYRGVNGDLWHRSISTGIEEDTYIAMEGVPDAAFAAGDTAPVLNVVTRSLQSAPVVNSTFQTSGAWSSRTLPGTLGNEPTIVPGQGNGEFWIFALGTDNRPYCWDSDGNFVLVSGTRALGPLSASLRSFEQGFHVFYEAWDHSVVHSYRTDRNASWQTESLGGATYGFPSGTVVPSTGDLVVFQLGTDGMLYWNQKANGDQTPTNPWSGWNSISEAAGATGTVLSGMPSFSLTSSGTWVVFVPTATGSKLAMFSSSSNGAWTYTDLGGDWISAPTATATGVFTEGKTTGLWQWIANVFSMIGGVFD